MKKIIGWQIESNDNTMEIPEGLYSFEVFVNLELVELYFEQEIDNPEKWMIVPIFEDTIEEPTFIDSF